MEVFPYTNYPGDPPGTLITPAVCILRQPFPGLMQLSAEETKKINDALDAPAPE